ncbi:unnamed protein product [Phaedon cochleariae]|uniref:Double jelly roll-like domain-containing protein n=1 Tax=Phaedon cochleariae TaxID=80249 RepID=A0A9N9SGT1_PHACE|nr:unnamed protein product [Phaedon cochleariae]
MKTEIRVENATEKAELPVPGLGVRHIQVGLLFSLLAIAYGMRVNLSVAIVAMTDVSTSSNPDVPKAKRDNAEADATHFDNTSIVSIRLALNGEYWPNERMQLDFTKQDYTLAYYNYTRFYSSYSHSTEVHPILDYGEFKQHALFVIDCSRQEETMKSSTVDIKLEIEADKGFPADTKAYCIIVHDCLLEYFPLTEVVRTLI